MKRANTACTQQLTAFNLFRKHFNELYHYIFLNWYYNSTQSLCEKCPNTEFFPIRIFPYSDWIRTRKNAVFGPFSRSEILSVTKSSVTYQEMEGFFLQIHYGFYMHHFQLLMIVCYWTKNSKLLMLGTWMLGGSWLNVTVWNGSCNLFFFFWQEELK